MKLTLPPAPPPDIDEPDAGIIDLSAYRDSKAVAPLMRTLRVVAIGPDRVRTEIVYGDQVDVLYTLNLTNMGRLVNFQRKALKAARDWDAENCRACGTKACASWHEGLILERYARGSPRFHCEGFTARGRVRLRSMATGKLVYSSGSYASHWGRVVGWVDLMPRKIESPTKRAT